MTKQLVQNLLHKELSYQTPRGLLVVLGVVWVLFRGFPVNAAEIVMETKSKEIKLGQQFEVSLFLDTQKEDINAVEGTIVFPDPLLELKEVRDAQSIVSFWVEKPNTPLTETHTNTNKHEVIFSGIVPGGYRGERGLLFSLVFFARKEAQALMELQDVKALLNDGRGTETNTKSGNLLVSIRADANIPSWIAPKDRERPESFVPEIARDPTVFRGKWFLVFSTQDKGSGSVHYELKETRQTRLGVFSKWTIVESPYVLRDQALRSYIFVKAVDRAGNARTVKVVPQNPLRWYENYEIWFIIMLGLVTVYEIKKVLPRISLRK